MLDEAAVLRLARLARLPLDAAEAARLAPVLETIARDFAALAEAAEALPPAPDESPGPLRADEAAPPADAASLLANARVDPATNALKVPRGGAP